LQVDYGADGLVAVEESAAEEIADEEGVGIERGHGSGGDEELLAGEELGVVDGAAAGKLEDDAAGVLAGGKEMLFEGEGLGGVAGLCGVFSGEPDLGAGSERFGKAGEGLGEELATTTLWTEQMGNGDPVGVGDIRHR